MNSHPKADGRSADEHAALTAERQCGAIAYRQLLAAGLSGPQISRRKRSGRLLPTPARGVYRMPGTPTGWMHDAWVAVLAGPRGTVVSHTTAAALYGLADPPTVPHVTVPRTASGRFAGATVHHTSLLAGDRRVVNGLPATALDRTIVECAAILEQEGLDKLIDAAIGRGLTRMESIRRAWDRAGPVGGGHRLAEGLAPYAGGAPPGSVKAAHALRLFRQWGLPAPECEYVVRDGQGRVVGRIDFVWRPWRFGLEYDGDEFHSPRRWGADDRRQEAIEALGIRLERADRFDLRPSSTRLRDLLTKIFSEPPFPDPGL
ncbi:MAG TPA: hypothetical protein VHL53_13955 [Acidimicrobiia bacterium]|nr:hypothetical protein [Acidimicrobiia bacterium]